MCTAVDSPYNVQREVEYNLNAKTGIVLEVLKTIFNPRIEATPVLGSHISTIQIYSLEVTVIAHGSM